MPWLLVYSINLFRKINKSQLVNATNEKDTQVEVEFDINGRQYLVRRCMKPNLFEIEVDGQKMHKQADDRAMQKILEENILKVNYKSVYSDSHTR